ncbi:hypothetical protein LA080_007815 [Diaporthe eres]|nr:hypothetical protein LA080_007815 [Diaporthe eres]
MESRHNDRFGRISLEGRRYVSTDRAQQRRIPQNLEGDSRNGEYFDPAKYRDWGYQIFPLNRIEAPSESPPRMDGVMDADTGADGMIPVQEERPRTLGQRDAGTQTVLGGEEKTFWVNQILDLALIPFMWTLIEVLQFVYGVEFDGFVQGAPNTIVRGCVTSVAALVIQILNYKLLFSIRVGRYLAVAVLVKGMAGLASSVVLLLNPGAADLGGDIALQLLLVASRAIIVPCFVLLTAAWYANINGCSTVRLLLWASGYPLLVLAVTHVSVAANASNTVYRAIYAGIATVCILLSVYIFNYVDMPGVSVWLDGARRRGPLQGPERWQQLHSSLQACLCGV